ncbi:MAG: hypothetical protein K2L48_03010 [Mycoplasmoidaceae bacterium]|nr:hypothetical protein [Mycoplasmoidaceae bacterium]
MKLKKMFKTLLVVACTFVPTSLLSNCSNSVVEYKQEYLSINYYGKDTIYSNKDEYYTIG